MISLRTIFGCIAFLPLCSGMIAAADLDFNRDIRPILSDKCIGCHGPDEEHREGDLRLDQLSSATEDRGGYAIIIPGDPDASELVARILTQDPDLMMPPEFAHKELKPEEKERLIEWIRQGAPYAEHWAYVAPQKVEPPQVQNDSWVRNDIDRYLLAAMEKQRLIPVDAADRTTLIRRLNFDIIGLPPTLEEVEDFQQGSLDEAIERAVNRLLESPHYGERLAIYWLDLVRYADTVGYHGDQDHSISPYRDWVIESFNINMPFDQFTREQLAGDLLPDRTIEQWVASGYNRLLQTTHEGGLQPKEYLAIYAADRVRNISSVWMGATLGCAQCHSHKYDPYTITDFYSMAAFFADIDEAKHFTNGGNKLPTNREPEIVVLPEELREKDELLKLELKSVTEQLSAKEIVEEQKADLEAKKAAIEAAIKELDRFRRRTMVSVSIKPREMRVLPRGNWLDDSGPVVTPAIPEFLGKVESEQERASRLDLANWLVDSNSESGLLTARVFVNRIWSLFFGRGIADLTDFGGQGSPPLHPELLDALAIQFVESGWDVKALIRTIVTSHAYRLSSITTPELDKADPENQFYARQERFRLPAEMIRDNALAVSGLLVTEVGGVSVKPYQPAGYYRHLNFPKRKYTAHTDDKQWRRGVYVHWQRQFLHPMLKAFDAPSREECTAERPRSNTPLAALTLLNDPTFVEAARVFAARIYQAEAVTDLDRLDFAFQLASSRNATETEQKILLELLYENRDYYGENRAEADRLVSVGQINPEKEIPAQELAAWTQVARVLLNLGEVTTRN